MRVHPRCYFIVICARGDKLPQRFRFHASSGKKLAIKRAVVLVRAALAEQFRPALIDQSSRHRRELLAQRCVRAARCTAFQVGSHGAQFFSVHYAMIVTQEFRLVADASNPSSFLTRCEGLTIKLSDRPLGSLAHNVGGKLSIIMIAARWSAVRCSALVRSSKSCASPSPSLIHRPIYLDSVFPASSALECLPLGRRKLHL